MSDADGYTAGKFSSEATGLAGSYHIFEMDMNGRPARHIGTFTSGTPGDRAQASADAIAVVNGFAAREAEWREQERRLDALGRL